MSTEQIAKPDEGPEVVPSDEPGIVIRNCLILSRKDQPIFSGDGVDMRIRMDGYVILPREIDPQEAAAAILQYQVTQGIRVIDKGGASVH